MKKLTYCLFWVSSNAPNEMKRYSSKKYYLPKPVIKNHNVMINGKNFYDQPIASHIKQHKETRKLTTGKSKDYAVGCLLDYENIKNHYRRIGIDCLFVLTILEKNQRSTTKIFSSKCNGPVKSGRIWRSKI